MSNNNSTCSSLNCTISNRMQGDGIREILYQVMSYYTMSVMLISLATNLWGVTQLQRFRRRHLFVPYLLGIFFSNIAYLMFSLYNLSHQYLVIYTGISLLNRYSCKASMLLMAAFRHVTPLCLAAIAVERYHHIFYQHKLPAGGSSRRKSYIHQSIVTVSLTVICCLVECWTIPYSIFEHGGLCTLRPAKTENEKIKKRSYTLLSMILVYFMPFTIASLVNGKLLYHLYRSGKTSVPAKMSVSEDRRISASKSRSDENGRRATIEASILTNGGNTSPSHTYWQRSPTGKFFQATASVRRRIYFQSSRPCKRESIDSHSSDRSRRTIDGPALASPTAPGIISPFMSIATPLRNSQGDLNNNPDNEDNDNTQSNDIFKRIAISVDQSLISNQGARDHQRLAYMGSDTSRASKQTAGSGDRSANKLSRHLTALQSRRRQRTFRLFLMVMFADMLINFPQKTTILCDLFAPGLISHFSVMRVSAFMIWHLQFIISALLVKLPLFRRRCEDTSRRPAATTFHHSAFSSRPVVKKISKLLTIRDETTSRRGLQRGLQRGLPTMHLAPTSYKLQLPPTTRSGSCHSIRDAMVRTDNLAPAIQLARMASSKSAISKISEESSITHHITSTSEKKTSSERSKPSLESTEHNVLIHHGKPKNTSYGTLHEPSEISPPNGHPIPAEVYVNHGVCFEI